MSRNLARWRCLCCALLLLLLTPPALGAAPTDRRPYSPEHGVNVFVYGEPTTTDRDLAKAHEMGFPWVKSLFRWSDIEAAHKGAYDWTEADRVVSAARKQGLKLIARLDFQPWWARADGARNGPPDDYQDFYDFVLAFATRYGSTSPIGRVHAIQIWNEPNLSREWGDQAINQESAAEYVRLLKGAYRAIKETSPGITVVSAGLAFGFTDPACCQPTDQYLQWMYEAGLEGSYDALGLNANFICPCIGNEPGSLAGYGHPSYYFRHVEQLREIMLASGGGDKQIWLTEFGWPVLAGEAADAEAAERAKGDVLLAAFQHAHRHWKPWIGVMALWTMASPSWNLADDQPWDDEQASWAVTNPDGSNRPAYDRLLQAFQSRELPWQRNGPP